MVLVYGAEQENFGFGRHLWIVLRLGCDGSREKKG